MKKSINESNNERTDRLFNANRGVETTAADAAVSRAVCNVPLSIAFVSVRSLFSSRIDRSECFETDAKIDANSRGISTLSGTTRRDVT